MERNRAKRRSCSSSAFFGWVEARMRAEVGAVVGGDDEGCFVHQTELADLGEEAFELRVSPLDFLVVDSPPESDVGVAESELAFIEPFFAEDFLLLDRAGELF